jgi:hypothetical protein
MQLLLSEQKAVLKPPDTPEFMRGAFQAADGARRDFLASASFKSGSAASAAPDACVQQVGIFLDDRWLVKGGIPR